MFRIMSSVDCGCSYHPEAEAETIEELQPIMEELDKNSQRWYVEKDNKQVDDKICSIHKNILGVLKREGGIQ